MVSEERAKSLRRVFMKAGSYEVTQQGRTLSPEPVTPSPRQVPYFCPRRWKLTE